MNVAVTNCRHDRIELNHISHQSDHDRGRATSISVSYINHGDRDETDFRDKLTTINGNSSKIRIACRGKSSPLETEPIVLCTIRSLISCEPVCRRNIYLQRVICAKQSQGHKTLIAGGYCNSSIVCTPVGYRRFVCPRPNSSLELRAWRWYHHGLAGFSLQSET